MNFKAKYEYNGPFGGLSSYINQNTNSELKQNIILL